MDVEVVFLDDPEGVLDAAGPFLASRPVHHNVILTILHERTQDSGPGNYWIARSGDDVVGVTVQSPVHFAASVTPAQPEVAAAMADAAADAGAGLTGVIGEPATAAGFAGRWTERHDSAAAPSQGQRLYEVDEVRSGSPVGGRLRRAGSEDRALVLAWMEDLQVATGERGGVHTPSIDARLSAGRYWLWEGADGPASLSANSEPVEGVVRVQAAYTPLRLRNRGYAGACVGALSARVRAAGHRCVLYADLGNPVSNVLFRRLGYRVVAEVIRYSFA